MSELTCPNCGKVGVSKAKVLLVEDGSEEIELDGEFIYCEDCGVMECD